MDGGSVVYGFFFVLFALLAACVALMVWAARAERVECVCAQCLAVGVVVPKRRGSLLAAFVLGLFFVVPALIYCVLWSVGERVRVCSVCGSEDVIPLDTPLGRALTARRPPVEEEAVPPHSWIG